MVEKEWTKMSDSTKDEAKTGSLGRVDRLVDVKEDRTRTPRGENEPKGDLAGKSSIVSQNDIDEIIRSLKKLTHDSVSLNEAVSLVDQKVSTTQLELDSLVSRSTNNNKHLKSLLLSAQDVRRLQELIEQLEKQQGARSSVIQEEHTEDTDAPDKIRQITEELQSYRDQHKSLQRLTQQVTEKERQLAVMSHDYDCVRQRLRERTQELATLKQEYEVIDSRINNSLLEKCKAVETNLAFSVSALQIHQGAPLTKMNRITSMLRNKPTGGRRVMSLNVVDKYDLSPENNSDDN